MYFDITNAEYLRDYQIKLFFEDGSSGIVDFSIYLDKKNIFRLFLDKDFFRAFHIEYGVLVWGDGELDIAPERLYTLATGKPILYQAETTNMA